MSKYQNFEQLPVWQEAASLYNLVLDLMEQPKFPSPPGFRNQLDRAALSISNNIAEGFERSTTNELLSFIGIARGSAGEVRSMMAVVMNRPKLKPFVPVLLRIKASAQSCIRQLSAWTGSIEDSPVKGKRYLTTQARQQLLAADKAREFRLSFLRNLTPNHPLYHSREAREARGEKIEE